MFDIAFIILLALLGNYFFKKIGLPGILGMIGAGLVLGPSGFDLIDVGVHHLLEEFKTVALIVILLRAGLGINRSTLKRIGGPAIRMSFIPGILEGSAILIASYYLLNLSWVEAGMLGFIIAAVSPAVVVPTMLALKELGYGKDKNVPTLVLTGASLDDVFAITIFSVFAGLASGAGTSWQHFVFGVPGGIVLGAIIGLIIGLFLLWFFKTFQLRNTMKAIVLMIVAVIFYDFTEWQEVKDCIPIAALLGVMSIGFIILEKNEKVAHNMSTKFNRIWVLAEILLFVYIGSRIDIHLIDPSLIPIGIGILLIGLTIRSLGVWISLLGSELNNKEKIFCMIAYWPKATVQAAIGAVPLAMITEGSIRPSIENVGESILAIAVLSIILTAPLGAIGIKYLGPKLLSRQK